MCPQHAWTPQRLAAALQRRGYSISRQTLWRACLRGHIEHTRTPGGHVRIDPAYVARHWPDLAEPLDEAA